MKKLAKHFGARNLLKRLLHQPNLVGLVRNLEAPVLTRLIHHIGLEDAGEIVGLATTDQLKKVFDEDLWKGDRPGAEEKFDAARFGLWLHVLAETGPAFLTKTLKEMDEDFLVAALSGLVFVVDIDELAIQYARRSRGTIEDDIEQKLLENALSQEFDNYWVISREAEAWEAVLFALTSLDTEDHAYLFGLLDRCARLSNDVLDDNGGLSDVLSENDRLGEDVAFEREKRRQREGYVAPRDATSFLALARSDGKSWWNEPDPISRAYFRDKLAGKSSPPEVTVFDNAHAFLELLEQADVLVSPSQVLQLSAGTTPHAQQPNVRALLEGSRGDALFERMGELSYLANILVSGCPMGDRAFRHSEAGEAVLATCELGIELMRRRGEKEIETFVAERGFIPVFRYGWYALFHELTVPAARALCSRLHSVQTELRQRAQHHGSGENPHVAWLSKEILSLREKLAQALGDSAPWKGREELGFLEAIVGAEEACTWRGLLDECPTFGGKFIDSWAALRKALEWVERTSGLPIA